MCISIKTSFPFLNFVGERMESRPTRTKRISLGIGPSSSHFSVKWVGAGRKPWLMLTRLICSCFKRFCCCRRKRRQQGVPPAGDVSRFESRVHAKDVLRAQVQFCDVHILFRWVLFVPNSKSLLSLGNLFEYLSMSLLRYSFNLCLSQKPKHERILIYLYEAPFCFCGTSPSAYERARALQTHVACCLLALTTKCFCVFVTPRFYRV